MAPKPRVIRQTVPTEDPEPTPPTNAGKSAEWSECSVANACLEYDGSKHLELPEPCRHCIANVTVVSISHLVVTLFANPM
ncbi:hypothetical protein RRF57_013361 [Xylaria bambusicola]|uniref:Uncharacterized protein n=1 Tax=Xylaria bambusicola TaxID=326684 RepID=A0AAN7V1M5_9PEZI